MIELIRTIRDTLAAGRSVVAATIVTNEGSTPRTAGSKMLVFEGDKIAGTVGGGLAEGLAMAEAAVVLANGGSRLMDFDMTGQASKGADLICGGRMRVFLERLDPEPATAALFARLADLLAQGSRGLLITGLDENGGGAPAGRCLLLPDGTLVGPSPGPEILAAAKRQGRGILAPIVLACAGARYFLEPALSPTPLILCGGGHVSRPTGQIAAMVGFRITVLDDRPEFANLDRFPFAVDTAVIDPAVGWLAGREITDAACIVIVTRGHAHDHDALAEALRTPAGYIGMIGSIPKRDAIYDKLLAAGFTTADLARVKSPIGLEIAAETPEEIAVSIVAELIEHRAAGRP
ncbi:XshC-Cox1-family protein [Solidesulfovibrio carbinoliphilus subsp. oakridgensis]|uniref:XshC-Cox1-family protein n=1 Tax=Solidesulfovibrio carbinoliphilus subsp. oakridgensis TaxID=694327 RepID=G7Q9I2_9BACT|nr:XdhC/CoxI family protein [Solidesulfovibrio carbinoliphilus]EHJ48622.1 XshC-Cox1-family protein [Solidesulfovibrio carbinoliphilus subsp. oakridgensis]